MADAWHKQFRKTSKSERTDRDGTVFDSKGEMRRWKELQLWQVAGHIRNLKRQVPFKLILSNGVPIRAKGGRIYSYVADFVYESKEQVAVKDGIPAYLWEEVIEDFKGFQSRESKFKIAVFEAIYGKKVRISK